MIAPVGSGMPSVYAGMSRNLGEVPAVNPVRRRTPEASEAAGAVESRAAAQNESLAAARDAAPAASAKGPAEAGKGLLVDMYA